MNNSRFKNIVNQQNNIKKYQPEYKKLGIKPESSDSILIKGTSVPRNVRVNSGQNEDLAWVSKQKRPDSKQNIIDNNNEVIIQEVRERSFINENFEDGANRSTPISYDEIPDYQKSVVNLSENNENTVQNAQFSDVSVGEFVLIFENEILGSGTYEQVTEAIEEILLSDKNGSISPQSLIVLKRMQILTGVLIKDI
jgi:hypothetical protein